jgi:hypothetical protein
LLNDLIKQYPDSEYARKAKYQLIKMDGSAGGSLAAMEKVGASDPNYLNVRYDVCLLRHQRWLSSRGTPDEPREASATIRAVEDYLALPGKKPSQRQLRAALLAVEAAADGKPTQPQAAGRLLKEATRWTADVEDQTLLASYHYHALRRDFIAGAPGVEEHATWLRENPAGRKYEQTALVILAKSADDALAAAGAEEKQPALKRAGAIYSRLSEVLGDDLESLASNRNAQVALFKSSDYQLQLGDSETASQGFDKLLAVAPKNRQFTLGAARAHFRAKHFEKALVNWRSLVRAAKEGEDSWYEAKYFQLACLAETNRETAAKVLQQFQLLHPEPPEAWGRQFRDLADRLKAR